MKAPNPRRREFVPGRNVRLEGRALLSTTAVAKPTIAVVQDQDGSRTLVVNASNGQDIGKVTIDPKGYSVQGKTDGRKFSWSSTRAAGIDEVIIRQAEQNDRFTVATKRGARVVVRQESGPDAGSGSVPVGTKLPSGGAAPWAGYTRDPSIPTMSAAEAQFAQAVFDAINVLRRQQGRLELILDPRAVDAAMLSASQNNQTNSFTHVNPAWKYPDPQSRAVFVGINPNVVSENLLIDYGRDEPDGIPLDAASVVELWHQSPGHNANLLSTLSHYGGVAVQGDIICFVGNW